MLICKDTQFQCIMQEAVVRREMRHCFYVLITCRLVYYFPKSPFIIILPTLRSKPCLVVGIPVLRAIFCLTAVMPTALLREKLNPGIFILVQ